MNKEHLHTSLSYLRKTLLTGGENDLDQVAQQMHMAKQLQSQNHSFPFDRYSLHGSNHNACIVTPHSGEQKQCITWCINHYLGLNRHPYMIQKVKDAIDRFGTGCGTSALSGGLNSLHKNIEDTVATMLGKEKVMIFPTGYSANLGAISALVSKKDLVIFDKECHASIIDGVKLAGADFLRFHHNEPSDLKNKLEKSCHQYKNILVVIESAYSMSGDLAPIKEIVSLKNEFDFKLYVDESHTFGLYGENGKGYCHQQGVAHQVDFLMSTFSKSCASIGGFVAMEAKYHTLLQWAANSYIFQACLTPADAAAIHAALEIIQSESQWQATLHEKNQYMRNRFLNNGFSLGKSESPIIPVYFEDPKTLYHTSERLYQEGIFSIAVCYPAVKVNEGRIRLILNATHTFEEIDQTIDVLTKIRKENIN